jgi:iron(II)-dependent oxidoreductase
MLIAALSCRLHAQGFDIDAGGEVIFGPPPAMDHTTWLTLLQQWRIAKKSQMHYDGSLYQRPALLWTQRNYMQPQMMVEDRYFYDPATRQYTADRYLDDLEKRYGGIDSVLMWPVYPNVGIDNRGQHDLLRDMPGGHAGVKKMIAEFHRRGVHVLFPMMPWDAGTRLQGLPFKDAVAQNFKDAGVDGANGDTMNTIGPEFLAASDALGHPLAFEPEVRHRESRRYPVRRDELGLLAAPRAFRLWTAINGSRLGILRTSASDGRTTTSTHSSARSINGDGFETWENVWGIWNGMTPRDAEATHRVATVERGLAEFFVSPDWEPMAATLHPDDVFSSRFPLGDRTVWVIGKPARRPISTGHNFRCLI